MNKIYRLAVGVFLLLLAAFLFRPRSDTGTANLVSQHTYNIHYDTQIYEASISEAGATDTLTHKIVSGVVPHHILAGSKIANFFKNLSQTDFETIIVLGPNHKNLGDSKFTLTDYSWQTPYGVLEADKKIIESLAGEAGVKNSPGIFEEEQSVYTLVPFIKYYFPKAKIVPIILKSQLTYEQSEILGGHLKSLKNDKTAIVASVDFSHYLSIEQARKNDTETEKLLKAGKFAEFFSLDSDYLDSPQALAALFEATGKENIFENEIIFQGNSANFGGDPQNTTSYFVIGFSGEPFVTLAAVGDIMLSRGVGDMLNKYGVNYPFLNTAEMLKSADTTFGNLETSITEGERVLSGQMRFRADPTSLEGLKYAGFDVLSLANNHTPDFGQKGLQDTFNYLHNAGIAYTGAGKNENEVGEPVIIERNGLKFAFLAYTDNALVPESYSVSENTAGTVFMDTEKLKSDVASGKKLADFVIVSMHSGTEYVAKPTTKQVEFARAAIDSGATLVLGHHPHVLQKVEQYNNGYILYSLGNFVFDQMWSEPTRQGVISLITFNNSGIINIENKPTIIENYSQPRFANLEEASVLSKQIPEVFVTSGIN